MRALAPHHPEGCLIAALIKVETNTDAAVRAVARLADHESSGVREEALLRLGDDPERSRSRLDVIRRAFWDDSDAVRVAAVQTATQVAAPGDAITADALGDLLLRESEDSVVSAAIEALLLLKVRTQTVRQGLQRIVGSGNEETSAEAAAALCELFSG